MAIGFTEVPSRPKGAFLGLAFNVRRAFETHYLAQPLLKREARYDAKGASSACLLK